MVGGSLGLEKFLPSIIGETWCRVGCMAKGQCNLLLISESPIGILLAWGWKSLPLISKGRGGAGAGGMAKGQCGLLFINESPNGASLALERESADAHRVPHRCFCWLYIS